MLNVSLTYVKINMQLPSFGINFSILKVWIKLSCILLVLKATSVPPPPMKENWELQMVIFLGFKETIAMR